MSKLKNLRRSRGLSQSQLSGLTGVNMRTLQHYEQGSKIFDHAKLDTILRVCIALGCRVEDLIEDPETLERLSIYREMEAR